MNSPQASAQCCADQVHNLDQEVLLAYGVEGQCTLRDTDAVHTPKRWAPLQAHIHGQENTHTHNDWYTKGYEW